MSMFSHNFFFFNEVEFKNLKTRISHGNKHLDPWITIIIVNLCNICFYSTEIEFHTKFDIL